MRAARGARRRALRGRDDPEALEEAQQVMGRYVMQYNTARPHSALHYLTPADYLRGPKRVQGKLAGRAAAYRAAAAERRTYWQSPSTTAPAPSLLRKQEVSFPLDHQSAQQVLNQDVIHAAPGQLVIKTALTPVK